MGKVKAYSYIRFSTKIQEKGHSEQRQTESSEKYLKEHLELELDTTLNMFDSGLSAYKGKHISQGSLGAFLDLITAGKIERGSVLLIENIDRLSRLLPTEAYRTFDKIIQGGIKIVTLQSGIEYSEKSINKNPGELYTIVGEIQRARQESDRKSYLVGKAWENKRKQAVEGKRKMTAKVPDWLQLSEDKKGFIINNDAQFAISVIFDKKLEGKGSEKIAKEMNQSAYWKPTGRKGKSPSWRKSYIDKLLHNDKRLIGEHQLYKFIDGKRVKIGDPISSYYPPIIELSKFERVQAQIKRNYQFKGYAGGRNGKMSNLFSPMAVCSECGSTMQFIDKGKPPKGAKYYLCDKEKRGIEGGCIYGKIRYDKIEEYILTYCMDLDVSDILPNDEIRNSELLTLKKSLLDINDRLTLADLNYKNAVASVLKAATETLRQTYENASNIAAIQIDKLKLECQEIESQIKLIDQGEMHAKEQLKNIHELIEKMKSMEDPQLFEVRVSLRNHLRRLIKLIKISDTSIVMFFHTSVSRGIHFRKDGTVFIQDALRNTRK
jgi:DNA invertase Pin-like site-specific DNA recombinase